MNTDKYNDIMTAITKHKTEEKQKMFSCQNGKTEKTIVVDHP